MGCGLNCWLIGMAIAGAAGGQQLTRLEAAAANPSHRDAMQLFGQLVGDWSFELVNYLPDGAVTRGAGEWQFGWILEGRAVQDVWRVPASAAAGRASGLPADHGTPTGYGTTVRFYDPAIGAWRVIWVGVLTGAVLEFTARAVGSEIVMEQERADEPTRWIFSEITAESWVVRPAAGGR